MWLGDALERLWWSRVLRRHQGCWLQLETVLMSQPIGLSSIGSQVHARVPSRFSSIQLCNPRGHSSPGSSVRGILQARIPEWVAIPSSRGSSRPRDRTRVSCIMQVGSLPPAPPGKPRQPGDTGVFQPEMQPLPGGILARLA